MAGWRRFRMLGKAGLRKAAMERAEAYRVHIEWALLQPGIYGRPISYEGAAKELNERHIQSPMGGRWGHSNVSAMAQRLGLHHPAACVPSEVQRARGLAIWKQHPTVTAAEIIRRLGPEQFLGKLRAWALLKECWRDAAMRSRVHRKVGWHLDRWTAARIRVSAIWEQNPAITGRQVIETIGQEHTLRKIWVQRILRDCWLASDSHSPKQRHVGRRLYNTVRARKRG